MNSDEAKSKMTLALELFEDLTIEEQIQLIEEEVERREGQFPLAEKLLQQLRNKLKQVN